jgi:hypothetical protein
MPYRLLTDYFSGMQYQNGYYATKPPFDENGVPITPPTGPQVLLGTRLDEELYRLTSDPHQLTNLLNRGASPEVQRERDTLRGYGEAFMTCSGRGCHALETQ